MKINLTPNVYQESPASRPIVIYKPLIEVLLVMNHRVGKTVRCLLDTGSDFNIFPWDYALALLGYSEESLRKGKPLKILGVGGSTKEAFGHLGTMENPYFKLENIPVYFMEKHPFPLLGRSGFMDRFTRIILDEKDKTLELVL